MNLTEHERCSRKKAVNPTHLYVLRIQTWQSSSPWMLEEKEGFSPAVSSDRRLVLFLWSTVTNFLFSHKYCKPCYMQVALSSDRKYRFKCIKRINHLLATEWQNTLDHDKWTKAAVWNKHRSNVLGPRWRHAQTNGLSCTWSSSQCRPSCWLVSQSHYKSFIIVNKHAGGWQVSTCTPYEY